MKHAAIFNEYLIQRVYHMLGIRFLTTTLLAIFALGTTSHAHADYIDSSLRKDLDLVAQRRIFFGHQSVGINLLEGIKQLSIMAGIPIHIVEVKAANEVGASMIGHTFIAENEKPFLKLKSFEQAMGIQPTGLDIALMKFCFVDFTAETDTKALFERYRSAIEELKARNPGTTFVHVTAPLTSKQSGLKEILKRMLGRSGSATNVRREEYNSLLRKAYQGREPIFDLARIESTAPDGTVITVEWNGIVAPAMASVYSNDGGHLNSIGELRAARELISVLAAIPVRPTSHGSAH